MRGKQEEKEMFWVKQGENKYCGGMEKIRSKCWPTLSKTGAEIKEETGETEGESAMGNQGQKQGRKNSS